MSHSSEEEEEEEEEDEDDETPLVTRKSSGFKMVTKVASEVTQDISGIMTSSDGEHKKEVSEAIATRIGSREMDVTREPQQQPDVKLDAEEIARKEAEARAQAEEQLRQAEARQAEIRAQQEEAMKKAQQEALLRAQQAQEQAIKEAQERAQREAQMRAQQAQEQAIKEAQERAQREARMRAQQAQAEAKAKQAEAEAQRRAQQEAQRRAEQAKVDAQKSAQQRAREAGSEAAARARTMQPAAEPIGQSQPRPEPPKSAEDAQVRREAQIKAEKDRAEQLRAQQKAKMMAAEQARQAQIQAQKLQQNRQPEPQQQQRQPVQQPQRQQPQVPTRQPQQVPQVPVKQPQRQQPQVPMKQLQQVPQQQQKGPVVPSKKQPAVPGKPQSTVPARPGQVASGAIAAGMGAPERGGGGAQQVQNVQSSATSAQQHKSAAPLIPYSEAEVRAMRGGDVQQAYLSKLNKPQALPEQQEVKPIHTQEDQSWVTQSRIPVEIQAPQPAKIIIPELHGAVDVKPTVIVPRPAQTTRVEWNEFPQDEVKEKRDVPRVKAGEWHPDNQGEIIGAQPLRSAYRPGRIGHVWPPPQSENVAPHHEVTMTKTTDDTAWRRDERVEMETGTAWGKAGPHNLREQRIWPPPENEVRTGGFTGVRLPTVQWPPPEFEQQVQQDVEIIQTRLPVKPNQRQWPPPPPEYRPAANQNQIIAEQNTQQIPSQKKVQKGTTTVTKGMVRVGGGR